VREALVGVEVAELRIGLFTPWGVRCGIYTYSRDLAGALAKLGVEVYVCRMPRFGALTPELIQLVVEKAPRDVDLYVVSHEYGLWKGLEAPFYQALRSLGKPIVTIAHAVGKWDVDKTIAECSSRVIVHNEYCLNRFGFRSKAVIIPHGCRVAETPSEEEAKKALGIDPRIPIVGYLGFISPYKGLEILIEAMREIPNAALLIGGGWHAGPDTQYIGQLKQLSFNVLPGRCQWLGYVPDERLAIVYGSMRVFVYPSRFATESGALLTALGHGRAVVASDLPPFREKEEFGALWCFRDVGDLREKVRVLLARDDTRRILEEMARRYCREHSWERVAEMHLELYRSVLEEGDG